MNPRMPRALLFGIGLYCLAGASFAAEMSPHFEPLRPLLGKAWRGVFPRSTPDKPIIDVARWDVALNGKAVRILHSINDGDYGGETLIVWDVERKSLVFFYFTTGGFYTTGTVSVEGGALVTLETVKGNAEGVTEVKGATRLLPDGRMHVKTLYRKHGDWIDGRDVYYVETKDAEVRFK